jgi:glycolate oxidase
MKIEILNDLAAIVGSDGVTTALIDLISYASDASNHCMRPAAAVWPADTAQVAAIVSLAAKHRLPLIPRGAGTGLAGSAVPVANAIVLDLCRMNRILDIRVADRLCVLQPGVVYADLNRALAAHGFFFPPDPASGSVCTIGGNVATNAGGIRGAKYGVTKDYVLALEVVLPDGRILRTGSACIKSASGYDLTRFFVGSEGTLGVVTEVTLKINPRPAAQSTAMAGFATLEDAGSAVSAIMHSGIIPSVCEIMESNTLDALRRHGNMTLPPAEALLLLETDGFTRADTRQQIAVIEAVCRNHAVTSFETAATVEAAEELWKVRRRIGGIAAALGSHNLSEDVAVPISRVPQILKAIAAIFGPTGLPFVIFGHAGDGNLHPKIMFDGTDAGQVRKAHAAVKQLFEVVCAAGGTLTGEHGIGMAKAPYMALEHDATALDFMWTLKKTVDPHNIMNPGKMHFPASI